MRSQLRTVIAEDHVLLRRQLLGRRTAPIARLLDLPPSDDDNRRVRAVLAYLQAAG